MGVLADAIHRLGPVNGLFYIASLALGRLSGGRARIFRYYFVAQPVPAVPPVPRTGKVTIRPVGADDPIVAQFPRPRRVIDKRYANGAVCLVAEDAQRFAGFIWLQFGPYEEDEVRCRYVTAPSGRTAWDFDIYVAPDYRLGRTFLRLWDSANAVLRERGVDWTVSRISVFNARSLRSHAHFGAERVRTATFLRCGAVQLMLSSGAPYVHVSLRRSSRPQLLLQAPAS